MNGNATLTNTPRYAHISSSYKKLCETNRVQTAYNWQKNFVRL